MANFYLIFTSIILEGFPFIIIGAIISALMEVFLSENFVKKYAGKNNFKTIFLFSAAGFLFPICECGIVPVIIRLRKKGVPTGPMIGYLLSAPAFQPIVLFSTYAAFNNRFDIAFLRIFVSLIIAVIIASLMKNENSEKDKSIIDNKNHDCHCECEHHEYNNPSNHNHQNCDKTHFHNKNKFYVFLNTFLNDAVLILVYLTIGASISALVSYYNPINLYKSHSYFSFIEIIILIFFAFVLSICSEADAFIAYSFSHFSLSAKLAFMWFGPMMDIKLLGMYLRVFNKKFVFKVVSFCFVLVFLFALIFQILFNLYH
ncbi:MAG TPA: permease [bacterium]|nr:permease [bacterium]